MGIKAERNYYGFKLLTVTAVATFPALHLVGVHAHHTFLDECYPNLHIAVLRLRFIAMANVRASLNWT